MLRSKRSLQTHNSGADMDEQTAQFLELVRSLSDREQKLMLACIKAYNNLPPEQRTEARLKQMVISLGLGSDPAPEMTVH